MRLALSRMALAALASAVAMAGCTGEPQPSDERLIVLQLRWCVLEGSEEAEGHPIGTLVTTHRKDADALQRANELWAPAHLLFVSVVAERGGVKGVPIIQDPDPFVDQDYEATGDIDAGDFSIEAPMVALECQHAWEELDPSLEGPIVVTVRRYVNVGFAESFGVASRPDPDLWLEGSRGDDLCSHPRGLTPRDVFKIDGITSEQDDVGWATVAEPREFRNLDHHARVMAHEFGHFLMLPHGNGLDDNQDGLAPGEPGPRRFDEYCDPLGGDEDVDAPCNSLMENNAPCEPLTALQVEQARAVAAVMPGCSGPCAP